MSENVAVSEGLSLRVTRRIKARRHRVFDSWTNPELLHLWFAPGTSRVQSATVDLRIGGVFRIVLENEAGGTLTARCVYTEIVLDEVLIFTWNWENLPSAGESRVTVTFHDADDGTDVVLTHERLATEDLVNRHSNGWNGCLENLARLYDPDTERTQYTNCN
jgi:uncharacterized protein YndB with AHSA1/START domain